MTLNEISLTKYYKWEEIRDKEMRLEKWSMRLVLRELHFPDKLVF